MKAKAVITLLCIVLWGCSSTPSNVPYPLDGTTWVFINKDENDKRFTLSFTTEVVTFTIFNKDGSIDQEPIHGTYTLSGDTITEVFDDHTITAKYSSRRITDSIDTKMVFAKQR